MFSTGMLMKIRTLSAKLKQLPWLKMGENISKMGENISKMSQTCCSYILIKLLSAVIHKLNSLNNKNGPEGSKSKAKVLHRTKTKKLKLRDTSRGSKGAKGLAKGLPRTKIQKPTKGAETSAANRRFTEYTGLRFSKDKFEIF